MSLTFIDTNKLPKKASTGQGEVTEVLNEAPVRGAERTWFVALAQIG